MRLVHLAAILFTMGLVSCCSAPDAEGLVEPCVAEAGKINLCDTVPETPEPETPIIEEDSDNPANPPRGDIVLMNWEAQIEQCEVQPETEWCRIECTTPRGYTRSWCTND